MAYELQLLRLARAQTEQLQRIDSLLTTLVYGAMPPRGLGRLEPIAERIDEMGHFIKNRQHMAVVPTGRNIAKQEFRALEDGQEILAWTEVAFDPNTGVEQPPLPEFWAEVGKVVTREARYTYADGTVTDAFSNQYDQVDNYTPPQPAPTDLGDTEQIDEVDADTRPT